MNAKDDPETIKTARDAFRRAFSQELPKGTKIVTDPDVSEIARLFAEPKER